MTNRGALRVKTAGCVGTFKGGSGFPVRFQGRKSGDYPFFKVSDMNNHGNEVFMKRANNYLLEAQRKQIGAVRVPADAIVFAKVGAAIFLERKRILAQDSCIDNNMAAFTLDPAIADVRYVYYLLSNFKMSSLVATTALPSLNGSQLRSIPLLIPEHLVEQHAIVTVLGDTDELIASLERLITKKQAMKQGMMQELLTGKTRLPGFTEAWTHLSVPALLTTLNARKHQSATMHYANVGAVPIVDQGKRPIVGYTDDVWRALHVGSDGVIVFGDHTCIVKYVDFDFVVGADGTRVLQARPGHSTRFIAHSLSLRPIPSTGYNRHYKFLKDLEFPVPQEDEQQAIAAALDEVDTEIETLRRRLVKAKAVKQGMMQELLTGRTRLPVEEGAA